MRKAKYTPQPIDTKDVVLPIVENPSRVDPLHRIPLTHVAVF